MARKGLPKNILRPLMIVFVLSWLLPLLWFAYFLAFGTDSFWERFDEFTALIVTAMLSGLVSLASALLTFHYRREEYGAGEVVIFYSSSIVSSGIFVCSGVWAIAILIFA